MATLVFDCVTVALETELDELSVTQLERVFKDNAVGESLSLTPLTGQLFAISLYDVERKQGVVYVTAGTETEEVKLRTEKQIIEDFW